MAVVLIMQDGVEKDEVGLISVYLGSLTISPGGEDRLYLQDGWADVLIMQDMIDEDEIGSVSLTLLPSNIIGASLFIYLRNFSRQ